MRFPPACSTQVSIQARSLHFPIARLFLAVRRSPRNQRTLLLLDFVGRVDPVRKLKAWLSGEGLPLPVGITSVSGPGGIGKTFLLEQAELDGGDNAKDVLEWFKSQGVQGKCPACGKKRWSIGGIVSASVANALGGDSTGMSSMHAESVPAVATICNDCGYVMLFSAMMMGL